VKIAAVEALHLRIPQLDSKVDGSQEVLLVRVTTDDGLVGLGEAVSSAAVVRAIVEAPLSKAFRHGLAAVLAGADPLDPEARWRGMYDATRWYGRRGVAIHAMAAVDTALWDIVGKHRGQPCHAVWGTRRGRVRAYASVLFRDDAAASAALAADLASRGFTAIKFGWGRFGRDRAWDLASLGAIRSAIGDGIDLMVDAGRIWTAGEALRRAPELFDRFALRWLEEPLHEDDRAGYARLAAAAPGWIAAGETEERESDFAALLDCGVKVVQPDIGRAGGPTVCRRLSAMAAARSVWCLPHSFGTGVNLAASAHWMASAEAAPMMEYPVTESPLRNELVTGIPRLQDGEVVIGDEPGLGIDLDADTIERYRV
jgi:L-alanine-DL-glutamate epimerase-like enolase superfamily enzyme